MWEQNLKETIEFIPPSAQGNEDRSLLGQASDAVTGAVSQIATGSSGGSTFKALWRNNGRSFEKKLGVFDVPNFNGAIIQDLGIGSDSYPLTVYFDGIDHDIEAERFYTALQRERGPWIVDHPVKGKIRLQLVSVTENISPLENGHYTEFETEWLKPNSLERVISEESLIDSVISTVNAVQAAAVRLQQARSDAYAGIMSAINTYEQIIGLADSILQELALTSAILQDAFQTERETLTAAIAAVDMAAPDFTDINTALIDLFEVPTTIEDFPVAFDTYDWFIDAIIALDDDTIDAAASKEFSLLMAVTALFNLLLSAQFSSRPEIISALENITDIYGRVLAALDVMQTKYSTGTIDEQYFPQTENYQDIYNIYATVIRYLFSQFLGLRAEKRFTLTTARSPLEITIAEYGSMGENDANYDLFLLSNKLSGNNILILPAGTQVVVYAG